VSVKNAVAPMGTGLTVNQARALTRLADKIILLFDGDTAGLKATLRAINLFLELNTMPWVVALPKGEDPDSLASKEPDRFLEMISSPQGWLDFLFSLSDEAYKKADAEKKLRILRRFDGIIGNVTEPTLKEILRQEVRGHYRLSMAWARELKKPRAGLVRLPEDNLLGKMYEEFLSLFAKSKEYQVIFDLIPTSYILSKKHRRIYDFLILKAYDKRNVSEWELEEDERSLLSLVQLNERVDRDGTAIYLLAVQVCMRYLEAEVMRLNKENADMERLTILQKYQQSLREYRYKIRVEDLGKVFNMLTKIRGMFPK